MAKQLLNNFQTINF